MRPTPPARHRPRFLAPPFAGVVGAAVACVALVALVRGADTAGTASSAAVIDFARDVRPILAQNCYKCHDASHRKGGLQLDEKKRALAGGDSGDKAITPGDPDKSKL